VLEDQRMSVQEAAAVVRDARARARRELVICARPTLTTVRHLNGAREVLPDRVAAADRAVRAARRCHFSVDLARRGPADPRRATFWRGLSSFMVSHLKWRFRVAFTITRGRCVRSLRGQG
jgi:hypothetical protein